MNTSTRTWWRRWAARKARADRFDAFLTASLRPFGLPNHQAGRDVSSEEQAALRILELARTADPSNAPRTSLDRQQVWRQVMANTQSPIATSGAEHASAGGQLAARRPIGSQVRRMPNHPDRHPWAWVNTLVAALLLLALGAGGLYTGQRLLDGNQGGEIPTSIPALSQSGDTPGSATPNSSADMVPPPGADECTVEPLTVDEVIAIVRDPHAFFTERYGASGTPLPSGPGNPAITGIVPDDDMAQVVALQRMWMACDIKGSYFQQWALEMPTLVADEVRNMLPAFTSEADARDILTQLKDTGAAPGFPESNDPLKIFWLINPDPAAAYYDGDTLYQSRAMYAPYTEYDQFGSAWSTTLEARYPEAGSWAIYRVSDARPWLIMDIDLDNLNCW